MAFEKVSPSHPDVLCDRIAGALVDMAYKKEKNPRIAVEVLLAHGHCHIVAETSVKLNKKEIKEAVYRIVREKVKVDYKEYPQDPHLAANQANGIRVGDNGVFKGIPVTDEQKRLAEIAKNIYEIYPYDGKYVLDGNKLIICQSHADSADLKRIFKRAIVNPLGSWIGGPNCDSGVTGRKLGSALGDSVVGGSPFGKDLSKADVSVTIYAFLKAQKSNKPVWISCAIGDQYVDGKPYAEIVEAARKYIESVGGFEAFAAWGLIRA